MAKTLKLTIIEKRFKKLHDLANFAKDYANAIVFHVQLIIHDGQSEKQCMATMKIVEQLNNWTEKFSPLASEMHKVESLYYATAGDEEAELIEEIPSIISPIVEPYKMTEELCKIGYIKINGDPYLTSEKVYTDEEIVENVENMYRNLALCIRALTSARYKGIWENAEKLAIDLHSTLPSEAINDFLSAYAWREFKSTNSGF